MLKIAEIETMITDELTQVSGLETVDIYVGEIQDVLTNTQKLPAALLVYDGAQAKLQKAGNLDLLFDVEFRFTIFLVGRNLKGRKEAGETIIPILEAVRGVLNGLQKGSAVLIWEEEGLQMMTKTGVAIYSQHYKCGEALTVRRVIK